MQFGHGSRASLFLAAILAVSSAGGCQPDAESVVARRLVPGIPTIGILVYDKVLTTEVTAPLDVFTKHPEGSAQPFNVITIGRSLDGVVSEEGLRITPDYTFLDAPRLDVLVIPSAYDMSAQVADSSLVRFIRHQDRNTTYTMSNCAGAQLVGASGIADGKRIVTWIGGGDELQQSYPNLNVLDDATVTFSRDGKLFSSNGNLASYVSALELLEEMTSREHRQFVESYLYLGRLRDWTPPTPEAQ